MKFIKMFLLIAMLTVGMMIISKKAEAENWINVWYNDYETCQIDASSCHWVNGALSFWSSERYTDSKQRNQLIAMLQSIADEDDLNVDYSNLREIRFHNVMYLAKNGILYSKLLYTTWYDDNGNIIDSEDSSSSDFEENPRDTRAKVEYSIASIHAQEKL